MRTQDEIIARIKEVEQDDFFGFQTGKLIDALVFENAKPYLKDDVTPEMWGEPEDPKVRILEYLPFAWEKATNCRGLSAGRSLDYMKAWIWLLGDDDVSWLDDYQFYGKPHLVIISERFGFDWRIYDDDCWRNDESDNGITADEALGRM